MQMPELKVSRSRRRAELESEVMYKEPVGVRMDGFRRVLRAPRVRECDVLGLDLLNEALWEGWRREALFTGGVDAAMGLVVVYSVG